MSNFEALEAAVDQAVAFNGGRLDALVASAGVTQPELFMDVPNLNLYNENIKFHIKSIFRRPS